MTMASNPNTAATISRTMQRTHFRNSGFKMRASAAQWSVYSAALSRFPFGMFRGNRFGFDDLRTHAVSDGQLEVFQFRIARICSIRSSQIVSGQTAMYGCGKHCKTSPSLNLNRGREGSVAHESVVLPGNRFMCLAPVARADMPSTRPTSVQSKQRNNTFPYLNGLGLTVAP
jgi:hypothetical protein